MNSVATIGNENDILRFGMLKIGKSVVHAEDRSHWNLLPDCRNIKYIEDKY